MTADLVDEIIASERAARTTIPRPDLSTRTALSKSALATFDFCATKAWHELRHRLPLIPAENITFGSALDRSIETVITYLRMDQPVDFDLADANAAAKAEEDGIETDLADVRHATRRFVTDIAPNYDWRLARLQEHLTAVHEDLGDLDGHPDIVLPRRIRDVKSSKRAKPNEPTVELGFYGVLLELAEGETVEDVGYLNWNRQGKRWQELVFPLTDELRRWTIEKAAAYIRAKRADVALNAKTANPVNYSFTAGPKNGSLCGSCQYSPMCDIAYRGEAGDDAA